MKKTLNSLLLVAYLISFQEAIAQENNINSQEIMSSDQRVDYKSLVASGKIHPDVYGLIVTLMITEPTSYDEADEIIKYFIARGCDINQSIIYSELKKHISNISKFYKNEETNKELTEQEITAQEPFWLKSISFLLRFNLFTIACGSNNIYLLKALLNNGISVNNWGGTAAFLNYTNEYDLINSAHYCTECLPKDYSDTILDIIKNIHTKSSFCTRSCLSAYAYLATSKNSYNKIVNN